MFGEDKRTTLPRYCRECGVLFACGGECPKHRFIRTPDGERGLNYLCAGYKLFFAHADPYLRFMVEELRRGRSPAHVMKWAREQERGGVEGGRRPRRNDPCPCGSGRICKLCCGRRGAGA
jgi:uncharacterized protein